MFSQLNLHWKEKVTLLLICLIWCDYLLLKELGQGANWRGRKRKNLGVVASGEGEGEEEVGVEKGKKCSPKEEKGWKDKLILNINIFKFKQTKIMKEA